MSKVKLNKKAIIHAVASLGRSSKAIARSLKAYKVKGEVNNLNTCPVAMFVKRQVPKSCRKRVEVDGNIHVYNIEGERIFHKQGSKALGKFIVDFDQGRYPELQR